MDWRRRVEREGRMAQRRTLRIVDMVVVMWCWGCFFALVVVVGVGSGQERNVATPGAVK